MKIALTLAVIGAAGYLLTLLVDRSVYGAGLRQAPVSIQLFGVGSFLLLAGALVASLICLIWGIA